MGTPAQSHKTPRTRGAALLEAFLDKHGVSRRGAAQDLDVSKTTILFWERGSARPELAHRQAIETWTCGAVPANAWVRDGEEPPRKVKPLKPRAA